MSLEDLLKKIDKGGEATLKELYDATLFTDVVMPCVRLVKASNGWCCTVGEFRDWSIKASIDPDPLTALRKGLEAYTARTELERDIGALI